MLDTSQVDGTVSIIHCIGMSKQNVSDMLNALSNIGSSMMNDLPNRISGHHFCYDSPTLQPGMSVFQMIMGKENRFHFRSHYGSDLEVMYSLRSFGIILDIEMLSDENYVANAVNKYIEERRKIESVRKEEELKLLQQGKVMYPCPRDVLLGRGRPYQSFSGNTRMAQYVLEGADEYQSIAGKGQKMSFSLGIVRRIQEEGGRFLIRKSDCWEVAPDISAREKVSHALRDCVKAKQANVTARVSTKESVLHLPIPVATPVSKKLKLDPESDLSDALSDSHYAL